MGYKDSSYFAHGQEDSIGVLVTNLGTPDAPTPSALRRYLKEFLSDPRVVEFPRLLWKIVLHGIILNIRPSRSAKAYQKVWTDKGSPLAIYTANQAALIQDHFKNKSSKIVVEWAMRYGKPSIEHAIDKLMSQGVRKLFVLPLYPQYSGSTSASTFDAIAKDFNKRRWIPELRFLTQYYTHPNYINALAESVKQYWAEHGKADKLIFSYHGVPLRYLHNGDPYHCQCLVTSRLLAQALELKKDDFLTTFQSRFGREPWLQPYTDETMESLATSGTKSVQVLCPGFSSDCLETIEEIAMENRDVFLENGGESFAYIPALNDRSEHIGALCQIIETNIADWCDTDSISKDEQLKLAKEHPYNQRV